MHEKLRELAERHQVPAELLEALDEDYRRADADRALLADRSQAAEGLRESERRFRDILENADMLSMILDVHGNVLYCNAHLCEVTGYAREELIGQSWFDRMLPPDQREARQRTFVERIGRGRVRQAREYEIVTRAGERRTIAWSNVVLRDAGGGLTGTASLGLDLTDRQRVQEMHGRLASIVNSSEDAIVETTLEGVVREWNAAAERIYGYSRAEMLGESIFVLAHPARKEDVAWILARVARGEPLHGHETVRRRKDGAEVEITTSVSPIRDPLGRVVAASALERDVTLHKRMYAQLVQADRLASVGTLAAGVAHEINNPLAYVISNLEYVTGIVRDQATKCLSATGAVTDDPLTALAEVASELSLLDESLRDALGGADRVRRIVRDLKIFARGDDDSHGGVDVRRVIDTSINMAMNEIRHRARLVRDYRDVPAVLANESRLGQVCLNLLVNAAQAITDGTVEDNEIRVSTYAGDGMVVIEISDTGGGIAGEHLARIFDPFFTTKDVGVGTGLGLSICHGIVKNLGGDILVESAVGKGTTFRVLLPASSTGTPAERPRHAWTQAARARILLVDDDVGFSRSMARLLALDHEVVLNASGQEALVTLAADQGFDLILCDVMMPEMSGIEVYAHIGAKWPELVKRLVFVTGGAFTSRAQDFLDKVKNLRLEKPFDAAAVARALEEVRS